MTKYEATLAKGFVFFVFLVLLGIAVTVYTQMRTTQPAKAANIQKNSPSPVPSAVPKSLKTQESDVHSSNADKKFVLRATPGQDGTTTYTFTVADLAGTNAHVLFTKTLGPGAVMSLPWNAWDPTDTYVFIGEKVGSALNYYVFKSSGEPFANGDKFIDVGAVWTEKKIGFSIRDATGWASGTLLIIYTSKDDGAKGPAFWFEIPSTAIIQLAG